MRTIILYLLIIASFTVSAQAKKLVYQSLYQINGVDLSLTVPDTLTQQLGINEKVKLPLGTIDYFNTCTGGASELRIAFSMNQGFSGIHSAEHVVYTDAKAKTYSHYKDGKFMQCVNYALPVLTAIGDSSSMNGYVSKPYQYTGGDSLKAVVWLSKALPVDVNPGLAFSNYSGGVAKIDYSLNGQQWSLDLVSFSKAKAGAVKDAQKRQPSSTTKQEHFLFHRNDSE